MESSRKANENSECSELWNKSSLYMETNTFDSSGDIKRPTILIAGLPRTWADRNEMDRESCPCSTYLGFIVPSEIHVRRSTWFLFGLECKDKRDRKRCKGAS